MAGNPHDPRLRLSPVRRCPQERRRSDDACSKANAPKDSENSHDFCSEACVSGDYPERAMGLGGCGTPSGAPSPLRRLQKRAWHVERLRRLPS